MSGNTCLYHPWIHFRDDEWLKTSLLFWKRVARIVPPSHQMSDSPLVRQFMEEGLIEGVEPQHGAKRVARRFADVITRNEDALRQRFGIDQLRNNWNHRAGNNQPFAPGSPVFIHVSKVAWPLQDALLMSGLAESGRSFGHFTDPFWLGVHPEIARVYMTLLAAEIAERRGAHPVSESETDLVCVGGWSVEALAAALLGTPGGEVNEAKRSPTATLAFTALRTVLPENLAAISPDQILSIRSKYGEELLAFRDAIQAVASDAELEKIAEPDAFQTQLRDAYEERVAPQLPKLEKDLRKLGVETSQGWLTLKVTLPPAVGWGLHEASVSDPAAVGAAVLLGMVGVTQSMRSKAQTILSESPAAYLLHLKREVGPSTSRERLGATLQKFALGI